MPIPQISILVVEDEPLVRIAIVAELEDHGFAVIEAANALEAIAVMERNPVVSVLFTDIDMPGSLDGLELARIIKDRYPPIQVVITSGHRDVVESDLPLDGRFLAKPYVPERVIQTILTLVQAAE